MSKPRQRFLILSIITLVLVSAFFFGYIIHRRHVKRNSAPVIMCASDELRISVTAPKEDLLIGVTAMDAEDGDLTSKIVIESISQFTEPGKCTITYAVFDSGHKVSTASRTLYYTDYHSPRFKLRTDLTYPVGTTVKPLASIEAEDCIDGSLTNRISMTVVDEGEMSSMDSKEVEFRVINSRGDVAVFRANIVVQERTSPNTPEIKLGLPEDGPNDYQYLVYIREGEEFDPMEYVKLIRLMNSDYTAEEFTAQFGAENLSCSFDPEKDSLKVGTNAIVFYCEHEGHIGSTTLYVIVEA